MKFTNGYWMTRPEYEMSYATEVFRVDRGEDSLDILAATRQVRGNRGANLNMPALNIRLSSPVENVLCVEITHFRGALERGPRFSIRREENQASVTHDTKGYRVRAGGLEAVVQEQGWAVDFLGDGRLLTTSGWHGMAHAYSKETGKAYMSDSLMLDVGEWVYGLGERFTPYLKNGQTVDIWNEDGGTASELAYKNIPFYMTSRGYGGAGR